MKFNWKKFCMCGIIATASAVSAAEMPSPVVYVGKVTGVKQSVSKKYVGNLSAVNDVDLIARVSGNILKQCFTDGDIVKKGQVLFILEDTTYKAQFQAAAARLARCKAEYAFAQSNLERLTLLKEKDATSKISFEDAVRQEATAKAAVAEAEAALKDAENMFSYTKIYAPFDGKTGKAAVSPFNYVTPASGTLVNVVSLSPLYINFWVSESDFMSMFGSFSELQKHAEIKLELADDTIHTEKAKVVFIDNKVNPATDSILIRAQVPNADYKLLPNALVTVQLARNESTEMPAVPVSAILNNGKIDFVYVVNADNSVSVRPVQTGILSGKLQIIRKGLKIGETIVVRGTNKVFPIPGFKIKPVTEK